MAIADRIKKEPTPSTHGLPCSIGHLFATLPESEQAALTSMLYELNWNATQVYDALRDEGHEVGRQSVNRHRGKRCRCYRDAS